MLESSMHRPWIKIETSTPDKPEICAIATKLRIDPDAVVGKLIRIWAWVEVNHIHSNDLGVTFEFLDKLVGHKGFALAMAQTGWLEQDGDTILLPNFERHNGHLTKGRLMTAKRVKRHRLRKQISNDSTATTATKPTKTAKPRKVSPTADAEPLAPAVSETAKTEPLPQEEAPSPQDVTSVAEDISNASSATIVVEASLDEAIPNEASDTKATISTQGKRKGKAGGSGEGEQPLLF